jgi:hypothetical protein
MTPDAPRPRATNQLPLTRNHLYALGALSLALAVLSFFVGFQAGKGRAAPVPVPQVARLVPDDVRTGDLEVLLAGVEHARGAESSLSFPAELPHTDPAPAPPVPLDPTAPEGTAMVAPVAAPPEPVAAPFPAEVHPGAGAVPPGPVPPLVPGGTGDVPLSGWAVQVGQHDVESDADRYVATLRAAGLSAYKVVALVGGHSVWRVRVGGFKSKEAATAALSGVASKAGSAEPSVTPAP